MDSLIDIRDLTTQEIDELLAVAMDIIADPAKYSDKCRGKKLATLFFEPSTRTRLSFEAAMQGCQCQNNSRRCGAAGAVPGAPQLCCS